MIEETPQKLQRDIEKAENTRFKEKYGRVPI
jgi:hypothetical protein